MKHSNRSRKSWGNWQRSGNKLVLGNSGCFTVDLSTIVSAKDCADIAKRLHASHAFKQPEDLYDLIEAFYDLDLCEVNPESIKQIVFKLWNPTTMPGKTQWGVWKYDAQQNTLSNATLELLVKRSGKRPSGSSAQNFDGRQAKQSLSERLGRGD